MRAIVVQRTGGPEVLELADVPEPSPGPGEVVVELRRDPTEVDHDETPTER